MFRVFQLRKFPLIGLSCCHFAVTFSAYVWYRKSPKNCHSLRKQRKTATTAIADGVFAPKAEIRVLAASSRTNVDVISMSACAPTADIRFNQDECPKSGRERAFVKHEPERPLCRCCRLNADSSQSEQTRPTALGEHYVHFAPTISRKPLLLALAGPGIRSPSQTEAKIYNPAATNRTLAVGTKLTALFKSCIDW